jgi:mono/diheme cytochrome c family protein
MLRHRNVILVFLVLVPVLLFAGVRPMGAAQTAAANQCAACHTDAAKLKALTPPDPTPTEAGEG